MSPGMLNHGGTWGPLQKWFDSNQTQGEAPPHEQTGWLISMGSTLNSQQLLISAKRPKQMVMSIRGYCWETFYILACCGWVANPKSPKPLRRSTQSLLLPLSFLPFLGPPASGALSHRFFFGRFGSPTKVDYVFILLFFSSSGTLILSCLLKDLDLAETNIRCISPVGFTGGCPFLGAMWLESSLSEGHPWPHLADMGLTNINMKWMRDETCFSMLPLLVLKGIDSLLILSRGPKQMDDSEGI